MCKKLRENPSKAGQRDGLPRTRIDGPGGLPLRPSASSQHRRRISTMEPFARLG